MGSSEGPTIGEVFAAQRQANIARVEAERAAADEVRVTRAESTDPHVIRAQQYERTRAEHVRAQIAAHEKDRQDKETAEREYWASPDGQARAQRIRAGLPY